MIFCCCTVVLWGRVKETAPFFYYENVRLVLLRLSHDIQELGWERKMQRPPCAISQDVVYYAPSSGEKGSAVLPALLTANEKETDNEERWSDGRHD